jgi:hypothetical protein
MCDAAMSLTHADVELFQPGRLVQVVFDTVLDIWLAIPVYENVKKTEHYTHFVDTLVAHNVELMAREDVRQQVHFFTLSLTSLHHLTGIEQQLRTTSVDPQEKEQDHVQVDTAVDDTESAFSELALESPDADADDDISSDTDDHAIDTPPLRGRTLLTSEQLSVHNYAIALHSNDQLMMVYDHVPLPNIQYVLDWRSFRLDKSVRKQDTYFVFYIESKDTAGSAGVSAVSHVFQWPSAPQSSTMYYPTRIFVSVGSLMLNPRQYGFDIVDDIMSATTLPIPAPLKIQEQDRIACSALLPHTLADMHAVAKRANTLPSFFPGLVVHDRTSGCRFPVYNKHFFDFMQNSRPDLTRMQPLSVAALILLRTFNRYAPSDEVRERHLREHTAPHFGDAFADLVVLMRIPMEVAVNYLLHVIRTRPMVDAEVQKLLSIIDDTRQHHHHNNDNRACAAVTKLNLSGLILSAIVDHQIYTVLDFTAFLLRFTMIEWPRLHGDVYNINLSGSHTLNTRRRLVADAYGTFARLLRKRI